MTVPHDPALTTSLTVTGNFELKSGARLVITVSGTENRRVNVGGKFTAAGSLQVTYDGNDGTPYILVQYGSREQSFTGGITVTKDGNVMPTEDYILDMNYNGNNTVVLIVQTQLTGDYFYWNGGTGGNSAAPNGRGGNGTWNTGNANWTDQAGSKTGKWPKRQSGCFRNPGRHGDTGRQRSFGGRSFLRC